MSIRKPTPEELTEILAKHKLWLESDGNDGARADLARADLAGADLAGADLARANLAGANLAGAYLARADLAGAKNNDLALSMTEIVPREGSFTAWKQTRLSQKIITKKVLVKLRIPEDAKRSNATGRKCRASKAEVLGMTDFDGNPVEESFSYYDGTFTYHVGDVLEVSDFDEDRLHECAPGIHFYLTPEEAKAHA